MAKFLRGPARRAAPIAKDGYKEFTEGLLIAIFMRFSNHPRIGGAKFLAGIRPAHGPVDGTFSQTES
jgi:hypothetical protein